jgi:hypothetical protein
MQNTIKIIHRLFFLIVWIASFNIKIRISIYKKNDAQQIFKRNFQVRRKHVEIWLRFFIKHYFDYKMIEIDLNRLI